MKDSYNPTCSQCPLSKIGDACEDVGSTFMRTDIENIDSIMDMIEALEQATIYAALDCFAEECAEMVRKA
jgi:hypothetical protein